MALSIFDEGPSSLDMRKALYAPLGAASPLWFLFGGAASAGLAYWWMTRWTDRSHLEAMFGAPAPAPMAFLAPTTVALTPEIEPEIEPDPAPQPIPPAVSEILSEAAEILEGVTAAAIEAVEQATETLLEPLAEPATKPKPKAKPPEEPPPGL